MLKLPLLKVTMRKKKKHKKKTKRQGISLHKLADFTSRSLNKAYENFKHKQKTKKSEKIKLEKREEARGIVRKKKELELKEEQIEKEK